MLREPLIQAMKTVFADVPYGIEHTLRVLHNADEIAAGEALTADLREVVTYTAILHDIGALEALRKHGSMEGIYQEMEGPAIARQILETVGCEPERAERVCFIIGHHHSPAMIDGLDFQILWEADLLDNLEFGEPKKDPREIEDTVREQFKTSAGKRLALTRLMGLGDEWMRR